MNTNSPKPDERFSKPELRYRIADYINDRAGAGHRGRASQLKPAAAGRSLGTPAAARPVFCFLQ
ncbi:MAG: hypothetical protein P4M04_14660 [Acidobacteriota bacterium]|nr:hypothetical protein [Acidobacteriota bacterium]